MEAEAGSVSGFLGTRWAWPMDWVLTVPLHRTHSLSRGPGARPQPRGQAHV